MAKNMAVMPSGKLRFIDPEKDDNMSNSITQNWTDQAIRCFYNRCDCSRCSIYKSGYSFECQMSSVVKVLLDELGPPDKERIWKSIIMAS